MSSQRNKDLVLSFFDEILDKRQFHRLSEFLAQDAINHTGQSQALGVVRDTRLCLKRLQRTFSEFRVTVQDIVAEQDIVVVRSSFLGNRKSGKPYRSITIHWFRVVDNLIVEHWGFCRSSKRSTNVKATM